MQQRSSSDNGGAGAQASGPRGPAAPPDGGAPLQAALTEALGAFSRDPGGAVRRLLDGAEQVLTGGSGAARHGGGGGAAISGLAAVASRLLSDALPARQQEANPPGAGATSPRDGAAHDVSAGPAAVAATPETSRFVPLLQPGATWFLFVRAEEVHAVAPAAPGGVGGCVLHMSDGGTVDAGEGSDEAAARLSPQGFVRLSQAGTQRGLYVRADAVTAVTAPVEAEGCVLRLRGGRALPAAEAAAVAAGLLLRPPLPPGAA